MTISEKVAYLKGLAEGLDLDVEKSKEGKLISVMIGILEDLGLSVEDLEDTVRALDGDIDDLAEGMAEIEDDLYGDDEDDDEDEDDDDFFEIECPSCEAKLVIDEDVLSAGEITCPNCDQKFELDLADDCGCDCGEDEE